MVAVEGMAEAVQRMAEDILTVGMVAVEVVMEEVMVEVIVVLAMAEVILDTVAVLV